MMIQGLGMRVQGVGMRAWVLGCTWTTPQTMVEGSEFRVWGVRVGPAGAG